MGDQFEVNGDKNTIIKGDRNTVNMTQKDDSFDIPVDDSLNIFVSLGRWLHNRVGKKWFLIIVLVPLISSLLVFAGYILWIVNAAKSGNFELDYLYILFITVPIMSIFGTFLHLYKSRLCPKCKKVFALREHKPQKHLGQGVYRGKILHNIKQFLRCDFCGHELEYEYTDEEEIQENE